MAKKGRPKPVAKGPDGAPSRWVSGDIFFSFAGLSERLGPKSQLAEAFHLEANLRKRSRKAVDASQRSLFWIHSGSSSYSCHAPAHLF